MAQPTDRLESEALGLPLRQRARLARLLVESFGSGDEADSAEQRRLAEEISRRAERAEILEEIALAQRQIARGEGVDHESAKARLRRAVQR